LHNNWRRLLMIHITILLAYCTIWRVNQITLRILYAMWWCKNSVENFMFMAIALPNKGVRYIDSLKKCMYSEIAEISCGHKCTMSHLLKNHEWLFSPPTEDPYALTLSFCNQLATVPLLLFGQKMQRPFMRLLFINPPMMTAL
jgi:hypothetical protein